VVLHYRNQPLTYEPSLDDPFVGRLRLNDEEKAWLSRMDEENDCWYLDDEGERLPADKLFEASPWSWQSPSGTVKLLQRFFDWNSGETRFDIPDTYLGELFDWVRGPKESR
jgi:hypothetical protein